MLNAKLGDVCRVARSLRGECNAAVLSGRRGRCVRKDGRRLVLHWETKGEYACVLDAPYNVSVVASVVDDAKQGGGDISDAVKSRLLV